jgi:CBS domain-containing protein
MKAAKLMRRPVVAATPRASVRDVAMQLVANGFSGMPVAERDGTVIGVITEADILRALTEGKPLETLAAEDIMTKDVITVDLETPMMDVMKMLQDHHILRVPVTDRGKLVGVISRIDLIRTVLEPEFMAF